MHITATLINLFHYCKREMWLHAHGIRMEHTSEVVYEGKLIHQTVYPQRAELFREIELEGSKIDFYDPREKVVHEIKKSDKAEAAHLAQAKYYLWLLERNGVEGATAILEYPKLRRTERVELTGQDRQLIPRWREEIARLLECDRCPPRLPVSKCRSCSYFDFCWAEEKEQPHT
ncbi:MAG: CRISPR-associated protein Cas4 [Cytophagales bacterium]|nr:CRISPR-associated protein Cas4 [Cytophagales bacterium]